MSISFHSTYEMIIGQVIEELDDDEDWEKRIPELVDEKSELFLRSQTLTPSEKVFATMVLSEKYGIDEEYVTEEADDIYLTANIDSAYYDAKDSTLTAVIRDRLGDQSATENLVTTDYSTDIPLSTRLAKMPEPVSIVELLLSELQEAGPEDQLAPREDELDDLIPNLLDEYKPLIWEGLCPAQKTHLIVRTERHFDATYGEPAEYVSEWVDVVGDKYLYEHLSKLLENQFSSAEALPDQQEQWIEMQLRDAAIRKPN